MVDWLDSEEEVALESLVSARTHEVSLVWRARIQILRQLQALPDQVRSDIAQLSEAIADIQGDE